MDPIGKGCTSGQGICGVGSGSRSSLVGVGWGLSGICPGAAYAGLGVGDWSILYAIGGMFIGAYIQGVWRSQRSSTETAVPSDD